MNGARQCGSKEPSRVRIEFEGWGTAACMSWSTADMQFVLRPDN